ncbi:MAG: hypothetical protein IKL44_07895 [Clostridia bacterium]|nr:hypothetical protein [Clostridia bacterium]
MILRFENDREGFLEDCVAEVSISTPIGSCAFQFDDEHAALTAMHNFHTLASMYERIIADLEKENATLKLKDDLAAAQKK